MGFSNAPGTDPLNNPNYTVMDGTAASAVSPPAGGAGPLGWLSGIFGAVSGAQKTQIVGTNTNNKTVVSASGYLATSASCFPYARIPKNSVSAGYVLISGPALFSQIWNASATDLSTNVTVALYDSSSTTPTGEPLYIISNWTAGQIFEFNLSLTSGLVAVIAGGSLNADAGLVATSALL